jgi:hypothetical protein
MQVWREDGVPKEVPLFITESNLSSQSSEAYLDVWSGLWLADYIGAFLGAGGNAVYYFHYLPSPLQPGHYGSPGTFNFFSADDRLQIRQPLAQFFTSQLINLQWLQPGNGEHRLFTAVGDVSDGAGHSLVTAYPVLRPDGEWAVLIVNKDQENGHQVTLSFDDPVRHRSGGFAGPVAAIVFGKAEYQWHPDVGGGTADPDGPARRATLEAAPGTVFTLPKASVTVLRGRVAMSGG